VVVHIEDIMFRAGNDFINLRADVHDNTDTIVVVCRAQLVVREAEKPVEVTA
jgi:hypothetical protein